MTRAQCVVAFVCAIALSISAANAKPRHQMPRNDSQALAYCAGDQSYRSVCPGEVTRTTDRRAGRVAVVDGTGADPRPGRWCMWWLRRELGIPKSAFRPYEYNLARAGRYIGLPASGPAVGAIVVWPHHVGIITARTESGWMIKSGNDGHAVRERERSVKGAIAFRWPNQWASR